MKSRLSVFILGCIFLSCNKKVELTPHAPGITFNTPAHAVSFRGGKVYFTVHAEAKAGLLTMQLLRSMNGADETTDTTFSVFGENFSWSFEYIVPDVDSLPSTIRLFFVVTDVEGRSASASFVVSVTGDPVLLGPVRNGVVYHAGASSRNAQWDLVNNVSRQVADSLYYDLRNITPAGVTTLVKGWRSPATSSFTEFTKLTGVNFDSVGAKELVNRWNNPAQVHVTQVSSLAVGEVLGVWLRNGAYGVIKITQIDDVTPGADNQFIRFIYRKQE